MPRTAGTACSRGSRNTASRSAASAAPRAASGSPVSFAECSRQALLRFCISPRPACTPMASERPSTSTRVGRDQPRRRVASGHRRRARVARRTRRCHRLAHRAAGLGQIDACDGARARVVRSRLAGLYARRRQRPARPQRRPRILARRPAGEHPAHRRGRRAVRRRRHRLHHRVHLAVSRRPARARAPLPASAASSKCT